MLFLISIELLEVTSIFKSAILQETFEETKF